MSQEYPRLWRGLLGEAHRAAPAPENMTVREISQNRIVYRDHTTWRDVVRSVRWVDGKPILGPIGAVQSGAAKSQPQPARAPQVPAATQAEARLRASILVALDREKAIKAEQEKAIKAEQSAADERLNAWIETRNAQTRSRAAMRK